MVCSSNPGMCLQFTFQTALCCISHVNRIANQRKKIHLANVNEYWSTNTGQQPTPAVELDLTEEIGHSDMQGCIVLERIISKVDLCWIVMTLSCALTKSISQFLGYYYSSSVCMCDLLLGIND